MATHNITQVGIDAKRKVCPECSHVFQGSGWNGIDAHWRSRHASVMPYEEAWPLIKTGTYTKADTRTQAQKFKQAARDLGLDEREVFDAALTKVVRRKLESASGPASPKAKKVSLRSVR